jgi:hypothetical protein
MVEAYQHRIGDTVASCFTGRIVVNSNNWILQGGSNMTGTFFFLTIISKHLLAHVSLQRTPLRSEHIFSNVLEAS